MHCGAPGCQWACGVCWKGGKRIEPMFGQSAIAPCPRFRALYILPCQCPRWCTTLPCPLRCSAQTHWPCPLQWTTTLPAENQCNATLPIDTHYLAWIQLLYYNTMCTIINNVCAILCPLFTVVRSTVTVTPLQYLKLDFTVRGWGRVETCCDGDIVVFTILWQMKREEVGFHIRRMCNLHHS